MSDATSTPKVQASRGLGPSWLGDRHYYSRLREIARSGLSMETTHRAQSMAP